MRTDYIDVWQLHNPTVEQVEGGDLVRVMEEVKKAYIFNKTDSRGAWLSEGETILGWKVESIDALTASLQQGGRSIELQLYPKR